MDAQIVIGVITAIVTAFGGYAVAKLNTGNDQEKFYVDKITHLLAVQAEEIKGLKEEIHQLTLENKSLTQQIMELKLELNKHNGGN
jgi:hypothetical protein